MTQRGRPRVPLAERFWSKVKKASENECWLWTGAISGGYGNIKDGTKVAKAHRVAYELTKGSVPDGLCVCHSCDVPLCVNPKHLWLGTNKQNTNDANVKLRLDRVLNPEEVLEIRKRAKRWIGPKSTGKRYMTNYRQLAREFGVSRQNIFAIMSGRSWKVVDE